MLNNLFSFIYYKIRAKLKNKNKKRKVAFGVTTPLLANFPINFSVGLKWSASLSVANIQSNF